MFTRPCSHIYDNLETASVAIVSRDNEPIMRSLLGEPYCVVLCVRGVVWWRCVRVCVHKQDN